MERERGRVLPAPARILPLPAPQPRPGTTLARQRDEAAPPSRSAKGNPSRSRRANEGHELGLECIEILVAEDHAAPQHVRVCVERVAAGRDGSAGRDSAVLDSARPQRIAATAIWPVPHLVIVGDGLIADALVASAQLLGWSTEVANDAAAADQVGQLASCDGVVVLSHDRAVDGPVLAAALAGDAGYVGALGARHTQSARAEWLAAHGVTDLTRVHGPAGLDLGARTPAEIAVAITAEMLAARSGRAPASLRERSGPVHDDGLNAPPPRYPLSSG